MKKTIPIKVEKVEITAENKCSFCVGSKCCSYITHKIETPKSKTDFDYLLWQVSHKNVRLYKDEDGWFLLVDNACNHLLPDGRCGIYEVRPAVCRTHTNDYCEYDAPAEEGFKHYFDGYESLLAYCKKRYKKWDQWKAKQAAEG